MGDYQAEPSPTIRAAATQAAPAPGPRLRPCSPREARGGADVGRIRAHSCRDRARRGRCRGRFRQLGLEPLLARSQQDLDHVSEISSSPGRLQGRKASVLQDLQSDDDLSGGCCRQRRQQASGSRQKVRTSTPATSSRQGRDTALLTIPAETRASAVSGIVSAEGRYVVLLGARTMLGWANPTPDLITRRGNLVAKKP
jgi:hypothetical protein